MSVLSLDVPIFMLYTERMNAAEIRPAKERLAEELWDVDFIKGVGIAKKGIVVFLPWEYEGVPIVVQQIGEVVAL